MTGTAALRGFPRPLVVTTFLTLLSVCVSSFAQAPQRGTITGTVTADQGEVRGFRVTAHNLQYKLWYTVFTSKGKYTIPQALPGLYDVIDNGEAPRESFLTYVRERLSGFADTTRERGASMPEEFILADLQTARAALEEISGRRAPEDLLAHIFARFCVGK